MENLQENKNPSVEGTEENAASLNYVHAFKKPTTIGGTEYKTLTFYFERLTGEDVEAVELELQQRNIIVLDASISSAFQSTIAARAARIPSDELRVLAATVSSAFQCGIAARASGIGADEIARLPLRHYLKIKNAARDFLVAVGY